MNNEQKTQALKDVYNIVSKDINNGEAKAYGVDLTSFATAIEIGSNPDVYDLIENIGLDKRQSQYDFVAITTTGWAAPLDPNGEIDCPPSQHNDRRRVTLLSMVNIRQSEISSAIKFDDEEEMVFDFGGATGSLNLAMLSLAE
jgi:hypothetical protein